MYYSAPRRTGGLDMASRVYETRGFKQLRLSRRAHAFDVICFRDPSAPHTRALARHDLQGTVLHARRSARSRDLPLYNRLTRKLRPDPVWIRFKRTANECDLLVL